MSSARKLAEAQFFIELLDALESRGASLTHSEDVEAEASFLLAATLNSFYSTVAIMRDEEGVDTSAFCHQHPEVYARAVAGGERAKTVHVRHVEASGRGYIPPPGNAVNFHLRRPPKLCPEPGSEPGVVKIQLRAPINLFVEVYGREMSILDFLQDHMFALAQFRRSL